MYKTRVQKKGKTKGNKKSNQKKRRKDNITLSHKAKKGQGKKLDKKQ
jgi:hypothetical protein